MIKRVYLLSLAFLLLIILCTTASAIMGSTRTGVVILRHNYSGIQIIDKSITVLNQNNYTIKISFKASEEIANITFFPTPEVYLEAGEIKEVPVSFTIMEPQITYGRINMFFSNPISFQAAGVVLTAKVSLFIRYANGTLPPIPEINYTKQDNESYVDSVVDLNLSESLDTKIELNNASNDTGRPLTLGGQDRPITTMDPSVTTTLNLNHYEKPNLMVGILIVIIIVGIIVVIYLLLITKQR